ncbi:MAG TPA: DNA polymerase III subunit gamma/tau [Acidimicrobiia bacterium]|nr:DNA polymerase III subunit gamma/tau [Acidimicrobiia bacterium]
MEYQALYRKYRPQSFDDVVGQGHVTATLAREVAENRVAHAYLFAGPRGTGKTTSARILAKALNCENRHPDGSPCNECESCTSIIEGSSLDVMELDAASHNSVEDIRDIRVSVTTVASHAGSKRVFILDEAHMLSKAAGNALLKTLEEPPDHVHFVLATTEPYKLLDTIRSRSQRFDFHPIPVEALAAHLGRIADLEGYTSDPSALVAVARHAAGSARDSLSLLEQVAALGDGTVDLAGVRRALGLAHSEAYNRMAEAIGSHDATSALHLVAELAAEGVDLRRFVAEGVAFFRGVFLAHYAPNLEEIADEPSDVLEAWRKTAASLPAADVLRAVDVLGEALIRLREGREERLMIELALIKLTRPEVTSDPDALAARIGRLERKVETMDESHTQAPAVEADTARSAPAPRPAPERVVAEPASPDREVRDSASLAVSTQEPDPPAAEEAPAATEDTPAPAASTEAAEPAAPPLQFGQLQSIWPGLFGGLRDVLGARRWALFREVVPAGVDGSTLILHVPHLFHLEQLQEDPAVGRVVATKAGDLLGKPVNVRFESPSGEAVAPTDPDAEEEIDLASEQLFEGPTEQADPAALLAAELGAELVEDD